MVRPDVGALVRVRAALEGVLRSTFDEAGLLHMSVPSVVRCPGMEPELRAFDVRPRSAIELRDHWLHTSPELAIKAVLTQIGADVWCMARVYRDDPPSPHHHAEFTMIEWYRLNAASARLMDDLELLVARLLAAPLPRAAALPGAEPLPGAGAVDVPARFARISVREAFARWVGVAPDAPLDVLAAAAAPLGGSADWGWNGLFTLLYTERVEPRLGGLGPVYVTDFPAAAAALARLQPHDATVADRFELYLPGSDGAAVELANAFGELTDPVEQRARFALDQAARLAAGEPVYAMPEAALAGIGNLPATAGVALGWERLLAWVASRRLGWTTTVADWLLVGATGNGGGR